MMHDFWRRCADARCVVVPVKVYEDADEYPDAFIGIKYLALGSVDSVCPPDYWFYLDKMTDGLGNLHDSPEAALEAYINKNGGHQETSND